MAADDVEILRCLALSFRQDKYCDVGFVCQILLPYVSSAAFRIILDYLYTGALHAPNDPPPAAAPLGTVHGQHPPQPHHQRHPHIPGHPSSSVASVPQVQGAAGGRGLKLAGLSSSLLSPLRVLPHTWLPPHLGSPTPAMLLAAARSMPLAAVAVVAPHSLTSVSSTSLSKTCTANSEVVQNARGSVQRNAIGNSARGPITGEGDRCVDAQGGETNGSSSISYSCSGGARRQDDACLVEAYATAQQYFLTSLQRQLLAHMEALLSTGHQDRIGFMMSLALEHGLEPLTALATAKWTAAQNPYSVSFTDAFSGAAVCACVTEAAAWAPSQVWVGK
ncbi:MAG: hypothetical protein WDW38_010372 [Sanguina aurantia]